VEVVALQSRTLWIAFPLSFALAGFLLAFASDRAKALDDVGSYKVIYRFGGGLDGGNPSSDLTMDSAGNLYGTTFVGGMVTASCSAGCGTVFELERTKDGWHERVLYSFAGGTDGQGPSAGVTFDSAENLYGTTVGGGNFWGTIFKLSPSSKGEWSEQVLYRFTGGADGMNPASDLILDQKGNLYGTTPGIDTNYGSVFELSPQANATWVETTLHSFTGPPDGLRPTGQLILDQQGSIYGLTVAGGTGKCAMYGAPGPGCGTLYQLTPGSSGWTETILYSFVLGQGRGNLPSGGLFRDEAGDFYGTTQSGGDEYGVVFKLGDTVEHGWQESVLYRFFSNLDGELPVGRLVSNSDGRLIGVTAGGGGRTGAGTIFGMQPPGSGSREKVLHTFGNGSDGAEPRAGVIFDPQGVLYGTALFGGGSSGCFGLGCGVVYELRP
jgi:hypothetical protein